MSYRKILFLLTAIMLFPLTAPGQDEALQQDFDSCVVNLNARCPIEHNEGWSILCFKNAGDTTHVELAFPSLLTAFLSALTVDTENARKLWVRQMRMFGQDWNSFVRLLLDARRTLVIDFTLGDDEEDGPLATMTFRREDFN